MKLENLSILALLMSTDSQECVTMVLVGVLKATSVCLSDFTADCEAKNQQA